MEDIKQESNENEEFNLSQIQIKEDYFEEAIDEDLEKKITSAKKNFFDFSESDKDFNQFGENKQNEDTENDTNKANENEEINNDDSVPEMDHPSVHNEQTSFENKGLDGLKSEQEKITKILIPGESVQNIENYIENVEKEDEAQQQHKSINKEDEDQQNPENTLESHGLNSSNNSSEKKDSYIDLKKTKSTEVIVMNEVENSNNNDKPIDSINSLEEDAEGIQTHTNEGVAEPAELAHDKSPILDEVVKKELEEASEDEIVEPVKINYMLPGEHEA